MFQFQISQCPGQRYQNWVEQLREASLYFVQWCRPILGGKWLLGEVTGVRMWVASERPG